MNAIFEDIEFDENHLYERIIDDLVSQKYTIVEDFFTAKEIEVLRQSLIEKHEVDPFKKSSN